MAIDRPVKWDDADADGIEALHVHGAFSATVVDTALLTIAMCGGNLAQAARELKAKDISVSAGALGKWRGELYPNRYRALCEKHRQQIEGVVLATAREISLRALRVTQAGIELEAERMKSGEVRDAAGSTRNMATAFGIVTDKVLLLEGRPTQIHEARTPDDIMRGLQAKGFVDSTAEDDDEPDGGVREPREPVPPAPPAPAPQPAIARGG